MNNSKHRIYSNFTDNIQPTPLPNGRMKVGAVANTSDALYNVRYNRF